MALFKKKEESKPEGIPKLPDLKLAEPPILPELPEMKKDDEDYDNEKISQLPSFPPGTLGDKFSQYNIKDAVSGKKEEAEEVEEDNQKMQKTPLKEEKRTMFYQTPEKVKEEEPIFIRIDKFEEGSKTFDEAKKQISAIEGMFEELKKVKEDEEKELKNFEEELREIKEKLEKIDENIFSKVG